MSFSQGPSVPVSSLLSSFSQSDMRARAVFEVMLGSALPALPWPWLEFFSFPIFARPRHKSSLDTPAKLIGNLFCLQQAGGRNCKSR